MISISFILLILLFAALLSVFIERYQTNTARYIALFALVLVSSYLIYSLATNTNNDFTELTIITRVSWISFFQIEYALALDNLSLMLISLTLFLAIICVLVSWHEINQHSGFYYFNLLLAIAGIIGVFTAIDMVLFFVFWEVMLLPITALIAIWGHEKRHQAAIKFFIFTQVSSLLMLIAIVFMALLHFKQIGHLSFFYPDWLVLTLSPKVSFYLMLGFFIAFSVKLPSFPVHSWLPDAHTQAPTAGSILLAGVLLKTGAYGLIRFVLTLFPEASQQFSSIALGLAVLSIIYGAKMAFAQQDFKRVIAYSSISHMGFVLLALYTFNSTSYQGALITLIAHGLSSSALFAMAGMIYARLHTRQLDSMGGFWLSAPNMGGFALVFCAAAFGMPVLANFVGEFLILVGAYQVAPLAVILSAFAIIGSAVYAMTLFQTSFQGKSVTAIADLTKRELFIVILLLLPLLLLGINPSIVLDYFPIIAANQR